MPKSIEELIQIANQGDPEALYQLGTKLLHGDEVPKDLKQATYAFIKAAKKEYAPAQRDLGILFLEGIGIPKNTTKAKQWIEKAALQKDKKAIDLLTKIKNDKQNENEKKDVEKKGVAYEGITAPQAGTIIKIKKKSA